MKRLALLLLLTSAPAGAQARLDDSDLSGRGFSPASIRRLDLEGRQEALSRVFAVTPAAKAAAAPQVGRINAVLALLDRDGSRHPARLAKVRLSGSGAPAAWAEADAAGALSIAAPAGLSGSYRLRFSLDNRFWAFRNPSDSAYEWESPAFTLPAPAGLDLGTLSPEPGSENGKLGVLHLTYLHALDFLKTNADVDWWQKPLTVNWPGSSDYFSPWSWSLELTNAMAWDVVLHELGHAVMHGSMRAESAGGQHKIDGCYSPALAWSEGWATFFAAAVRLPRGDADAKFEYLVPRRAPIRLENVPEDVCRGQSNEWRVAAGLWDLYDTHEDGGDGFGLDFGVLFKPLQGQSMGSIGSAWQLIAKGLDGGQKKAGEAALAWNTLLPARELNVLLPSAPADWLRTAPWASRPSRR